MGKRRLTTEEFITRSVAIHGDRYNYELTEYSVSTKKVKIVCYVHGEFAQSPFHHLSGKGCPLCSKSHKNTTDEFIEKAVAVHGDKYNYKRTKYVNSKTKVEIICDIHGTFKQAPNNHLNKKGCPLCSKSHKNTTDEFIEKAKTIHNFKYDYSFVDYNKSNINVKIICPIHGEFEQRPNNHLSGSGCPSCNSSTGNIAIENFLKRHCILFKREQTFGGCTYVKPLKFDFYLPDHNTCIEFDGIQHFEPVDHFGGMPAFIELYKRDNIKNAYCQDNQIRLIRIPYTDFENTEKILESKLLISCE